MQGIYLQTQSKSFGLYTGFVLIEDNSKGFRVSPFSSCTLKHLKKTYPNMTIYHFIRAID